MVPRRLCFNLIIIFGHVADKGARFLEKTLFYKPLWRVLVCCSRQLSTVPDEHMVRVGDRLPAILDPDAEDRSVHPGDAPPATPLRPLCPSAVDKCTRSLPAGKIGYYWSFKRFMIC